MLRALYATGRVICVITMLALPGPVTFVAEWLPVFYVAGLDSPLFADIMLSTC